MPEVDVRILDSDNLLLAGRRLHAWRYLEAGYVAKLDPGGVIDDPWVDVSTYLGAFDGHEDMVGVVRVIPNTDRGLPVTEDFELSALGQAHLARVPQSTLAEVSALAVKADETASRSGYVAGALYRAAVQYSVVARGHTHWVAALDVRVKRHLIRRHGFLFEDLGPARTYLGSDTVPAILDLLGQIRHFALTAPEQNAYFLAGLAIDLRGDRVWLEPDSGEYVPATAGGEADDDADAIAS